jgi:hypothetical protein
MLEDVADRVFRELKANGYEPRLDDFKTMVRIGEEFGLGLKLDGNGWITLD